MDRALTAGAAAFATSAPRRRTFDGWSANASIALLLNDASAIEGSDYRFTPTDGLRRHARVVTITRA